LSRVSPQTAGLREFWLLALSQLLLLAAATSSCTETLVKSSEKIVKSAVQTNLFIYNSEYNGDMIQLFIKKD